MKQIVSSVCIPGTANMAGSTTVARIVGKQLLQYM